MQNRRFLDREGEKRPMKIAIAGLGYVGLSLACLLAQDNEIMGVDYKKFD